MLNAIYEADFLGFSYGFRPGRNQHQALDALAVGIFRKKVNWVLDADIRGFFDAINHEWLRRFLEHRIADRRILQLIQKWLRAGILQDGVKIQSDQGSPQGATISPLLANVFLHYVFDLWVESWRRRCATGEVIVVRYADDLVLGFQRRADAVKFQAELERRLAKFGLELNSEKTRLLQFGVFATKSRREHGDGKPETFEFLGFTHICGRSRKERFLLVRLTSKKRMRATLRALREGFKKRRHLPLPDQGVWIRQVLQGYFAYYAVPTNSMRLDSLRSQIIRSWLQALRRRSQRTRMTWKRMIPLVEKWIPPRPRAASLACATFRRQNPRQEPSAVILHAGICAGPSRKGEGSSLPRPDVRTRGETPLHRAAAFAVEEAIDLLLAHGARREAQDLSGETPLSWASWHLRPDAILRKLCFGEFSIHPQRQGTYDHGTGWGTLDAALLGRPHLSGQ